MRYRTPDASRYLLEQHGISRTARTLQNLRRKGGGPRFRKGNQNEIYYEQTDLDAWVKDLLSEPLENTAQDKKVLELLERVQQALEPMSAK